MRVTTSRSILCGMGGGREGEAGQAGAQGGPPGGEAGMGQALEDDRDDEVAGGAAAAAGRQHERPAEGGGGAKERQGEREAAGGEAGAHPIFSGANVEKMEAAPHLPRWMSGQCKLLRELLGGLRKEWVAKDMEGVEGR